VQQAVWAEDPSQPVDAIARLSDILVGSAGDRRFQAIVLGTFAAAGLALALVGIYGVAAAAVKAQPWEVGVRLALGATPGWIVGDMLSEAGRRVGVGTTAGLVLFLVLCRAAASLLYETSFDDPRVIVAASVPLAAAAVLISYLQARRLARVPPVTAMRGEST